MASSTVRRLRWLGLCLFLCAPARERALAQFSTPYDPDFPTPEERPRPEAKPALPVYDEGAEEAPAPTLLLPKTLGPFLLLDRPDASRLFEREVSTRPADLAQTLAKLKAFQVSQERWNKMRIDRELGLLPSEFEEEIAPLPPSEIFVSTDHPKPPPPEVELPSYGTSLAITGRKVVGFAFSEKRFLNEQTTTGRPKSLNLIDITQQLQLRMQGKVGPKITVNVDYDDTKINKQDISVVYTGDPNEVVQNASFGDIDLSLPATEFVSYNKQLFGIRADIKWKGLKSSFIGSRTKGTTKSKQFIGNSQFVSTDILDTNYIRRVYYDVAFGDPTRLPIRAGTERVYLAQNDPKAVNTNSLTLSADDLGVPTSSFTGTFTQLAPGQDYTIDYIRGIVTFRLAVQPQFVVAIDYIDATGAPLSQQTSSAKSGGTGLAKLIKTFGDVPIVSSTTEQGYNRELKTFYSLGQNQVIRDNGRGNFILKVLDPKRNEVGPDLVPAQKYPDTIEVDFENGLFRLQQPFGLSVSSPIPDPDIYAPNPISKRLIHAEFSFRVRTFFLEPNLVLQSEVALIDGVRLVRNVDYFIDYDSGFITFFNDERIRPQSIIDISYEVAPFTGVTTESILGGRVSYDFGSHWSVGSTVLYQAGSKPPTVPSVNDLAKSLLIYEGDSQLKDLRLLKWLKATFQVEYARSHEDPNLSRYALIDNMEGIKQTDVASTFATNWQIAANPTQGPADPLALNWITEDVTTLQINPNAQATPSDNTKVLNFQYDFNVSASTEVSLVYVFSPTGLDFSQKQLLEVIMLGDASNNEINFTLGGIDENADGTGAFRTEDANNDGILQATEDIGFLYAPLGKNSRRYGAGNGRIDSADLNKNGRIDPADTSGDSYGYNFSALTPVHANLFDTTTNSTRTVIDFGGTTWHTFQIPLNISSATATRWTAIKELRISIRRRPGGAASGVLKFARLAVVGNSWQRGQAGDPFTGAGAKGNESLSVTAVNNVDNTNYVPIYNYGGDAQSTFNDLYGSLGNLQQQSNSKNVQEQSLQLLWGELAAGTTVFTKRVFPRSINISQHRKFNFLLYGNADPNNVDTTGNRVFFLRVGSDANFFEVRIPIDFVGWRRFTIDQIDTTGGQIATGWTIGDHATPRTVVFSTGAPNLQQVGSLIAGLYTGAGVPTKGAVFLNEIYLADPITRIGTAQKIQLDFDVPGWMSFGGKYRSVDRNYMTPTTVISNQDNRQDTAYLNFVRLPFFPMNFTVARQIIQTPNVAQTGDLSNLVNLLQSGKVTTWNGTANGAFAYGAYPRLSVGYVRARTEYDLLTRLDDRNTYNSALSYAVPLNNRFVPKTLDTNFSWSKYSVSFENLAVRRFPGNFNTDEFTTTYGARLTFTPWLGSSFNPNFSRTQVKESRSDLTTGPEIILHYPKSMNQTVGFSSNFRFLSWFNPSVNYTLNTIENNVLTPSTFIVTGSTFNFNVGDIKTINRSATGGVSLLLNISEIWRTTRLFRSFSLANGYQLQDGDVWNNIEKEYSSKTDFWIRTPLRPRNRVATRATLTERDTFNSTQRWSPLEAYDIPGRPAAFKTLSLSNNFLKSIQRTEVTGTPSKTIATTLPDVVASLSQVERLLWSERWMANGQINLKYARRTTEVVATSFSEDDSMGADMRAIIRRRFDTAFTFNIRNSQNKDLRLGLVTQQTHHEDATLQTTFDIGHVRFTPKTDYSLDTARQGTGVQTQHLTVITPSILARADLSLPRGLMMPFTNRTLLFTNRIIWTSTIAMALRSSPVTQADNSKLLNFNTSADYEIAKNLRMTLNGAFSRLWHRFLKEEDFISYQFGTTLTFQF